jgi:hypothetical protein
MHDRPDGAHLLRLARQSLLDSLAPALAEEGRFAARLVAKAMAIAAHELETGDADARAQRRRLEALFGELRDSAETAAAAESLGEVLERLNWRLAAEVRAGGRDADPAVHALLVQAAEARLKIVKPSAAKANRMPAS